MQISQVSTKRDIEAARSLFHEYAGWLRIDLRFQRFAEEAANLPGIYAPPTGRLLIAWSSQQPGGCVALRPVLDTACEMKRLYVKPAFHGQGLGRRLAEQVIAEGKAAGYTRMVLDTLPFMRDAIRLYERLGFARCSPYYDTPIQGTIFMELHL